MIKFVKGTEDAISSEEMSIGQTGVIIDGDNHLYDGIPIGRINNINSEREVLLVDLTDLSRTWTAVKFEVRLCHFELEEMSL